MDAPIPPRLFRAVRPVVTEAVVEVHSYDEYFPGSERVVETRSGGCASPGDHQGMRCQYLPLKWTRVQETCLLPAKHQKLFIVPLLFDIHLVSVRDKK